MTIQNLLLYSLLTLLFSGVMQAQTFAMRDAFEYVEDQGAAFVDTEAVVTYDGGDYSGWLLRGSFIQGTFQSGDSLFVSPNSVIGLSGDSAFYLGTYFAEVLSVTNFLEFSFVESVTVTALMVESLTRRLVYQNLSQTPASSPRTLRYRLTDFQTAILDQNIAITVVPVNDPPAAEDDDVDLDEDGLVIISPLANDIDVDHPPSTLFILALDVSNTLGTAEILPNGTQIEYTAPPQFSGADELSYTVSDPEGGDDSGLINITINGVNDPPQRLVDIADVAVEEDPQDDLCLVALSTVFSDLEDGTALNYAISSNSNTNLVQVSLDGDCVVLSYTPEASGQAEIVVTATDNGQPPDDPQTLAVSDTFLINVRAVNDAPFLLLGIEDVSVNEDASTISCLVDLTTIFSDIEDAGDLDFAISANSNDELLTASLDGTCIVLEFDMPNASGSAEIIISATDNGQPPDDPQSLSVADTFRVIVQGINDAPVIENALADLILDVHTGDEGQLILVADLRDVFNDVEDGHALQFTVAQVNPDLIELVDISPADTLYISLLPGVVGSDLITVTATDFAQPPDDQTVLSISDAFVVSVGGVNTPPQVMNPIADLSVSEDAPALLPYVDLQQVFFDNEDDDALTFDIPGDFTNSPVLPSLRDDNLLDLAFPSDQNGSVEITVRATDSGDLLGQNPLQSEHSFTVSVAPVNDAPLVEETIDDLVIPAGVTFIDDYVQLADIFEDVEDGDNLQYAVDAGGAGGIVEVLLDELNGTLDIVLENEIEFSALISVTATDHGEPAGTNPLSVSTSFELGFSLCPAIVSGSVRVTSAAVIYQEAVEVAADLSSEYPGMTVRLHYAKSDGSQSAVTGMTSGGAGSYQGIIPASYVDDGGLSYYIEASADGCPLLLSEIRFESISVPAGAVSTTMDKDRWFMFSVPYSIDQSGDREILSLLSGLGVESEETWRIFRAEPSGTDFYDLAALQAMGAAGRFEPGNAFWLFVRESESQSISMPAMHTLSGDASLTITLDQGWTQFGNPYGLDLRWPEDVEVSTSERLPIFHYSPSQSNNGWNSDLTSGSSFMLEPWEGYAIYNGSGGSVSLTFLADAKPSALHPVSPAAADWKLIISATNSGSYSRAAIGMAETALAGKDVLDYLTPPLMGSDYISVSMERNEWQAGEGRFSTDFRPLHQEGDNWSFTIESSSPWAELVLEGIESLPEEFHSLLIDRKYGESWEIDEESRITVRDIGVKEENRFLLAVGTTVFLDQVAAGIDLLVPLEHRLLPNYPNPFNPLTRIPYQLASAGRVELVLFNSLGERVRTLVDQMQPAGYYHVEWNGLTDNGQPTASGFYFYQLRNSTIVQTRKMLKIQ